MSDKKIIIRNCPSCTKQDVCIAMYLRTSVDCKERNDCVMKQIVELCKEESSLIQHKQKIKVKGLNKLADKIFELLDIQEVE